MHCLELYSNIEFVYLRWNLKEFHRFFMLIC
uniref:Uncharacterized protein n=1 Tax=Myoviridae sp. ctStS16 TaxID=2826654 RepID=A0A8S5QQ62_9CAUD|nr:MAG TPA: hypothetical protein [Myoviridae sp. ctStS16]DAN28586.1 MAG TPA: hypothetical protein [Caudoviricetes sp.]DAN64708.1 MAG TPA: hypothetical protein [Caudoviricetes sp.]DAO10228.1 MAG TPA: hypothetical protein [Caudoviricetes sp.]DAQ02345.1 MAG TPA: hypothetical protein [Caudoviricetes sp.]